MADRTTVRSSLVRRRSDRCRDGEAEFGHDPDADRPARMVDRRRCDHAGGTPARRKAVSGSVTLAAIGNSAGRASAEGRTGAIWTSLKVLYRQSSGAMWRLQTTETAARSPRLSGRG